MGARAGEQHGQIGALLSNPLANREQGAVAGQGVAMGPEKRARGAVIAVGNDRNRACAIPVQCQISL